MTKKGKKKTMPAPLQKDRLEHPQEFLPGAEIDKADDNHVDMDLVDQRVKRQNNNPRSHDLF